MRALLLATVLVAFAACAKRPAPEIEKTPELATVEVSAAPDAAYSTADDQVERRASADAMAGALPDGFPADIPIYRPSSLIDFVARPEGGYRVVFTAPAAVSTVRAALGEKLRAAGWQQEPAGVWTKGGRRLRLDVAESAAGTRFQIEL